MFTLYADVALKLPLPDLYTYHVPPELTDALRPGMRVRVTFHHREEEAFVVGLHRNDPGLETQPVLELIDAAPVLIAEQLELAQWMAEYYLAGPGECLAKMVPSGKRRAVVPEKIAPPRRPERALTEEQAATLAAIAADWNPATAKRATTHLIHGVTGSGKTELYIRLILTTLDAGRSALLLVPEISLTVQLIERLRAVFGEELALLHSALGVRERFSAYMDALEGRRRIAVGTRSAVFAPIKNPGVIILDEEHDGSYKEHSAPRYDARQIAARRAARAGALLVLGSATPRMESAYFARAQAESSGFRYHRMERRATGAALPHVEILPVSSPDIPISLQLSREIGKNLERGEQSLLLLNRRGYNPFVSCESCRQTEACPNCTVTLNLHRDGRLVCHYCNYARLFDGVCSSCGGKSRRFGSGSQRLEERLLELHPAARIERLDTDVAARKHAVRDVINRLIAGEIDILVGTQMIAKGLDAPRVTLVGVLQADQGLGLADFRAAERTFALLTQVAGRAGRSDLPGRVFFECFNPENPVAQEAARQDYEAFYRSEILNRKEADYPPFCRLIRLLIRGEEAERADAAIEALAARLANLLPQDESVRMLGPAPAPMERLNNQFRRHIILKTRRMSAIRPLVARAIREHALDRRVHLEVDLDPADLL